MVFLIDRADKQRPTVLQVGDHHHAYDAEDQLAPARPLGRTDLFGRTRRNCHNFLPMRVFLLCYFNVNLLGSQLRKIGINKIVIDTAGQTDFGTRNWSKTT
jgi:hypothetical protein